MQLVKSLIEAKKGGYERDFMETLSEEEMKLLSPHMKVSVAINDSEIIISKHNVNDKDLPSNIEKSNTWKIYEKWMIENSGLPKSAIEEYDRSTTNIEKILNNSKQNRLYGLIVGHVQSGKTGHYTSLLAKLADSDFTFVIVLSGILNDLRRQTQKRLMKDLVGDSHDMLENEKCIPTENRKGWEILTTLDDDVKKVVTQVLPERMDNDNKIITLIVKKNVNVLEHLLNGIKATKEQILSKHRVLIIDDEADHATVNTGGPGDEFYDENLQNREYDDDITDSMDSDPSKTNILVRRIIKAFDKSAYIGYTATPYANVLIDESIDDPKYGKSLYPRDFIVCLRKPDSYFGAEKFFGDPLAKQSDTPYTVILSKEQEEKFYSIDEDDDKLIEDRIPKSLQTAIIDFILSGIIRKLRRDNGIKMNKHHTMLIHITRLKDEQQDYKNLVDDLIDTWKINSSAVLGSFGENFRLRIKQRWEKEFVMKNTYDETWNQIEEELMKQEEDDGFMHSIQVRMINSLSDENLDYSESKDGLNIIAIGGNKLSRGLTLEGLCISFYLRRSTAYDSLMQMGRWFGYRMGYEDLVRVHTSQTLINWFEWLITVERAIREDIARYSMFGKTPKELAVRIPLHRKLNPTGRNKMKSAVSTITNYASQTAQSIHLPLNDREILTNNFQSVVGLFDKIKNSNDVIKERTECWSSVSNEIIIQFLMNMELPGPPGATFDLNGIITYIHEISKTHPTFTVAHGGTSWDNLSQNLGDEPSIVDKLNINPRWVVRSQRSLADGTPSNDVRAVSDPRDFSNVYKFGGDSPALIIYFIAPGSEPRKNAINRVKVPDNGIPIVALALKFPSDNFSSQIGVVSAKGINNEVVESDD